MSIVAGTTSSTKCSPTSLVVQWSDELVSHFPWLWSRDHAHDDHTMHPITQQRPVYSAALPTDLGCAQLAVSDDEVTITWTDLAQPPSLLPVPFLAQYRVAQTGASELRGVWAAEVGSAGRGTGARRIGGSYAN